MTVHFDFWLTDEDAQLLFDCVNVFIYRTETDLLALKYSVTQKKNWTMQEMNGINKERLFYERIISYLKKLKEIMKNEELGDLPEDRCCCDNPERKFVKIDYESMTCVNCLGNIYPVDYEGSK